MVMFAEKVLRRLGGNWTFVVITDRQELDEQIAGTFAAAGALTKLVKDCQAQNRVHLRELLAGQERYVFTLIHKFSTERGEPMPVLSERSDIIVITDEAHRSQYDQLAANMRRALPNAAFIGFTGTPLIAGQEERTREVFGDYVSVYVGVFQNLQKALAIYAAKGSDSSPIRDKDELVVELEKALAEARAFCAAVGVDVDTIFNAQKLARLTLISQAVEALVAPDERRRAFFRVAGAAARAYKALLPDERAAPYLKPVATLHEGARYGRPEPDARPSCREAGKACRRVQPWHSWRGSVLRGAQGPRCHDGGGGTPRGPRGS
jgi:type I site-specific restriction-modification system R (restriction) subunit